MPLCEAVIVFFPERGIIGIQGRFHAFKLKFSLECLAFTLQVVLAFVRFRQSPYGLSALVFKCFETFEHSVMFLHILDVVRDIQVLDVVRDVQVLGSLHFGFPLFILRVVMHGSYIYEFLII